MLGASVGSPSHPIEEVWYSTNQTSPNLFHNTCFTVSKLVISSAEHLRVIAPGNTAVYIDVEALANYSQHCIRFRQSGIWTLHLQHTRHVRSQRKLLGHAGKQYNKKFIV